MARPRNASTGTPVRLTISTQSRQLLDELAKRGVWGRNAGEVASRFVDQALKEFVEAPRFLLRTKRVVLAEPTHGGKEKKTAEGA
jgi:hypothetical protein